MKLPFAIVDESWLYGRWHDYFISLQTSTPVSDAYVFNQHTPIRFFSVGEYTSAIQDIFVLRPHLRFRVREIAAMLPSKFIGLFVRRGDKLNKEAKFIPISDILQHISYDAKDVFFVQTDDARVIDEMKSIVPNRILSIVSPAKQGSYHKDWLHKSPEQIREDTEEMLVGLSVCLRGRECWTDDTSNVGRFLKLISPGNVHIYPANYELDPNTLIHPSFGFEAQRA